MRLPWPRPGGPQRHGCGCCLCLALLQLQHLVSGAPPAGAPPGQGAQRGADAAGKPGQPGHQVVSTLLQLQLAWQSSTSGLLNLGQPAAAPLSIRLSPVGCGPTSDLPNPCCAPAAPAGERAVLHSRWGRERRRRECCRQRQQDGRGGTSAGRSGHLRTQEHRACGHWRGFWGRAAKGRVKNGPGEQPALVTTQPGSAAGHGCLL